MNSSRFLASDSIFLSSRGLDALEFLLLSSMSICDTVIHNSKSIYLIFVPIPDTELLKPCNFLTAEDDQGVFVVLIM